MSALPISTESGAAVLAQLICVAANRYARVTSLESNADDFVRGEARGEERQILRVARIFGGFEAGDSDAYIIAWARRIMEQYP